MAERRDSGDSDDGRYSVESGQQDDRSHTGAHEDGTGAPNTDHDGGDRPEPSRETRQTDEGITAEPGGEVIDFRSRVNSATDHGGAFEFADTVDEDSDEEPVDLAQLQADDELLDRLGATDPEIDSAGSKNTDLESLLVAWRRDVDSTPIDELVDAERAAHAISEGRGGRTNPRIRKRRHLVPVASAAAVLMIAFTGVSVAARDATPGDALWGVAQVLYTDHARSAKAASLAESQLENASKEWENGNRDAAQHALERAEKQLSTVDPGDQLSDLQAAHASLSAKFDRRPEIPPVGSSEPSTSSERSSATQPTKLPTETSVPKPPVPTPSTGPSTPSSSPDEPTESSTPSESSGSRGSTSNSFSGTSGNGTIGTQPTR